MINYIVNILSNSYNFIKTHQKKVFLGVSVCLLLVSAYNLGSIVALEGLKRPVEYRLGGTLVNTLPEMSHIPSTISKQPDSSHTNPTVVASKNTKTKLYHFTWCSGAARITDKNKVTFPNEAAAVAAGYSLAGNCMK